MRRGNKKVELLKRVWLFSACTNQELALIASLADEVDVDAGTRLTKEGTPGREVFVVAAGDATCRIGKRKVAEYGPGDFFGEMSLLDQGLRTATVTSDTDMKLYVLNAQGFATLLDKSPAVARKILRVMAQRLREMDKVLART